jgi:hypothetical protein
VPALRPYVRLRMHRLSPDKIERLRDCLDSGMSSRATAKAVPCSLNTVTNYRRSLDLLCGCGKPASHFGWCAYRLEARTPSTASCACGRPSDHAGLCRVRIDKMRRREAVIVDVEDPRLALLEARCNALERRVRELEVASKPPDRALSAPAPPSKKPPSVPGPVSPAGSPSRVAPTPPTIAQVQSPFVGSPIGAAPRRPPPETGGRSRLFDVR